jgi:DNA (cytosine-5)-methyltransferase 1
MVARKERSRTALVRRKLARLREGGQPRVADLFSGCGGFSLGFQRAGCEIIAGVEIDPDAAASHALNFHLKPKGLPLPTAADFARDITRLEPEQRLQELGYPAGAEVVDFVIGGPPCPAFARVGRAKLRDVRQHAQAFLMDERAQLFRPYLNWVETLLPVAVVMENVPDFLNFGGENLAEVICKLLESLGYRPAYTLLNSANYGVPQMRERFILIALHEEVGVDPVFPEPSHHVDFPDGYAGSRNVAFKTLVDGRSRHFRPSPSTQHLDPVKDRAVTISEALKDLPSITSHLEGTLKRGRRSLQNALPDGLDATPWVSEHMRAWPGHLAAKGPTAHVIRSLSFRDYRLFSKMTPGDEYPAAYELALGMFDRFLVDLVAEGWTLPEDGDSAKKLAALLGDALSAPQSFTATRQAEASALVTAVDAERSALAVALARLQDRWPGIDPLPSITAAWTAYRAIPSLLVPPVKPKPLRKLLNEAPKEANRQRRWLEKRAAWAASLDALGRPAETVRPELELPFAHVDEAVIEAGLAAMAADPARPLHPPQELVVAVNQAKGVALVAVSHRIGAFLHLKDAFVPPYDPMKFPNKWRKVSPEEPARTLMAHLGKDSYSHIHYDNEQARTISVREAARLQSFPDGFRFCGSMNAGFRQVGNAVPPLFAWQVAMAVRRSVGGLGEEK